MLICPRCTLELAAERASDGQMYVCRTSCGHRSTTNDTDRLKTYLARLQIRDTPFGA